MDFLMVIMGSGIARGHVCTMAAAAEWCKMAAILQLIGWQTYAALVYNIPLWYSTSMLWSIDPFQNKEPCDHIVGSSLDLI